MERPAMTGARAMRSLVPGWNNLLVEECSGPLPQEELGGLLLLHPL